MTSTTKKMIPAVIAAGMLASLCVVGQASAGLDAWSGIAGSAARGSESSCFNEVFGGVRNDCRTRKYYVLPVTVHRSSGVADPSAVRQQVRARGVRGTANRVHCQGWWVIPELQRFHAGTMDGTTQHTGATEYLRTGSGWSGSGTNYVYCSMDPGTTIESYSNQAVTW